MVSGAEMIPTGSKGEESGSLQTCLTGPASIYVIAHFESRTCTEPQA
jgi:hypothetical protein